MVERNLAKVEVAGSNPVVRSRELSTFKRTRLFRRELHPQRGFTSLRNMTARGLLASRAMGETIEFASDGGTASGYLATPAQTPAPGVLVIQEWWGLVPQIMRPATGSQRPGSSPWRPTSTTVSIAEHTEMDKAGELMNALPTDRAARDMGGARSTPARPPGGLGRLGRGRRVLHGRHARARARGAAGRQDRRGGAVLRRAARRRRSPTGPGSTAPVLGHFAENDGFFPTDGCIALGEALDEDDKDITFVVYPGLGHAFANEEDPLGTHDEAAAQQAWSRTIDFLQFQLD